MKRIIVNILLVLVASVFLLRFDGERVIELDLFERSENLFYDMRMNYQSELKYNSDIFIVDIDDHSLGEIGRWPWRRDVIAELIRRLFDDLNVRMAVFSFPLPEADVVGEQIMSELKDRFRFDQSVVFAIESIASEYDFDRTLAREIDGHKVLLNYTLTERMSAVGAIPAPSILFDAKKSGPLGRDDARRASASLKVYDGYVGNLEALQSAAEASGVMTPVIDDDGVVRRVPMLASFRGVVYESLPVRIARHYKAGNPDQLQTTLMDRRLKGLVLGERKIPLNQDGTIFINYTASGGRDGGIFQYVSASGILEGSRAEHKNMGGKIAIIGSSSSRLNQLIASPLNPEYPTAELLAISTANLLNSDVLYRPLDAWFKEGQFFLLIGLVLAVLMPLLGPMLALPVVGAVCYGVAYYNLQLWGEQGAVYDVFPFIVLITLLLLWNLVLGFIIEYRSTRRMQGVLGQYLPPSLAKRMSKSRRSIAALKGEEKELSILFSDVRGFTSISEQFDPQALATFMNEMLTALSECIHNQNGTIDKYIGDAVMAFWGAPLDDPKHALHSVMAALEMQTAIGKLSANMEKKRLPRLKLGIGICTGRARVGNMGSNIRLNYTVMGDSVNTASRLEGITKYYDVPILVSDLTANEAGIEGPIAFREIDTIRVKGKTLPIKIYQPVGLRTKLNSYNLSAIEEFHKALEMYKNRDFTNCLAKLYTLREQFPDDGLFVAYINRLEDLQSQPLAADWEPIWNFVTK